MAASASAAAAGSGQIAGHCWLAGWPHVAPSVCFEPELNFSFLHFTQSRTYKRRQTSRQTDRQRERRAEYIWRHRHRHRFRPRHRRGGYSNMPSAFALLSCSVCLPWPHGAYAQFAVEAAPAILAARATNRHVVCLSAIYCMSERPIL